MAGPISAGWPDMTWMLRPRRMPPADHGSPAAVAGEQPGGHFLKPQPGDGVERGERLVHQHHAGFIRRAQQDQPAAGIPPESSAGRARSRSPSPTLSSSSRARPVRAGVIFSPRSLEPTRTLSSAPSQGSSRSCCAIGSRCGRRAGARPRRSLQSGVRVRPVPRRVAAAWSCRCDWVPVEQLHCPPSSEKSSPSNTAAPSKIRRACRIITPILGQTCRCGWMMSCMGH